jgi:Ribbon-helix-helix protein, copG family.
MKKAPHTKKKIWPWGKSLPRFKTEADEIKFWQTYEFEPPPENVGEVLVYEPQATRHPRNHVYRIRLDDQEMALLQRLAKRRGSPASVVLRMLIREQAAHIA